MKAGFFAVLSFALVAAACQPSKERTAPRPATSAPASIAAVASTPAKSKTVPGSPTDAPRAPSANRALTRARPYLSGKPDSKPPSSGFPLVLYLHGFGSNAAGLVKVLDVARFAKAHGFAYAAPNGTLDSKGARFWNATDGCCDFEKKKVDDVKYLLAVIDDAQHRFHTNKARTYVIGFSNGGFMAHRLACDASDRIAAIASIAGSNWKNEEKCRPQHPVSVLQVHGKRDRVVRFEGGRTLGRRDAAEHPSAKAVAAFWARVDGCGVDPLGRKTLDLHEKWPGAETVVLSYPHCKTGAVQLWAVEGGSHFVAQTQKAQEAIWAFLSVRSNGTAGR